MLLLFLALLVGASIIFAIWYYFILKKATSKAVLIAQAPPQSWSDEFLENKRLHTDLVADEVVKSIMKQGEKNHVNRLFGMIVNDNDTLPEELPHQLKKYFEDTAQLPPWADEDMIKLGQQIYIRHGVLISLLLSFKSLPECYACAKGAMVLFHTARLNEQHGSMDTYSRRIAETAQFVLYAMSPGGLSPEGRGMRAIQKVRLIHAVIRFYLHQKDWDVAQFGEPINQEDMAGTLMSFSALVLEGLELINVELTTTEKEAYIHCWRVIGHLMGLDDDLIPINAADALALGHRILDRQIAPSEQGRSLMEALLRFQEKTSPVAIDADTTQQMMRFMMGDKIADMLGVPPADKQSVEQLANKVRFFVDVEEVLDRTILLAILVQAVSKIMLQRMIDLMDKNQIINFYIPESLQRDWGVSA
ncbi:oxygenase MpaB family protein [Runella sp. MFBS21]|uniref:oxygenase MpaB family protein n=1 Tax=Runella sp. MFBS21 TaxID=3034018 RepID=UPI0023F6C4BA|nr:oxygenase MpaB family protein [Runella sp. MFBS21]MDF7818319.1 oxygenase MpaB family protein [Runella sp. MFBS21]